MSEVGHKDLSKLLQSKRDYNNAIVTTRKRKLRELFAVATGAAAEPSNDGVVATNNDVSASTPAEAAFLEHNQISSAKKFHESSIPTRHQLPFDILSRSLSLLGYNAPITTLPIPATEHRRHASPQTSRGSHRKVSPGTASTVTATPTPPPPAQRISPTGQRPSDAKPPTPRAAAATPIVPRPPSTGPAHLAQKPGTPPVSVQQPHKKPTPQPTPAGAPPQPATTTIPTLQQPVPRPLPPKKIAAKESIPVHAPRPIAPAPPTPAANAIARPISTEPKGTTNGVSPSPAAHATSRSEGAGTPTDGLSGRRPQQVSFPPGTKGSPTDATKPLAPQRPGPPPPPATGPQNISQAQAQPILGKPSDSVVVDTRMPDAPSSPESIAPSATTPAAHDVSTDTSPDHEPSHYEEPGPEKEKDRTQAQDKGIPTAASVGARTTESTIPGPEDAVESAEDQLLRESRQSTEAKIAAQESQGVAESGTASKAPHEAPTSKAASVEVKGVPTAPVEPKAPALEFALAQKSTDPTISLEIPDSRDVSVDRMDVDASSGPKDTKPKAVPQTSRVEPPTTKDATEGESTPSTVNISASAKTNDEPPVAERAVTRVSSGAMRPKSVSEIVSSLAAQDSSADRHSEARDHQLTPFTSMSQSPTPRSRRVSSMRKDRPKGQVSAVLFGKQPQRIDESELTVGNKESAQPIDDYYMPLFIQGFARGSQWMQPLEKMLYHANKTFSTSESLMTIQDHQACKVLHRVYHLQSSDKWTLRQPKRAPEPTRPASQWDVVIREAKWMRTDFREERKWKMAVARNFAQACAEWCVATPEERKSMQVNARIPSKDDAEVEDISMAEGKEPTPDLVHDNAASPRVVDELADVFPETAAPSAIFALEEDDVVFGLRRSAAADQLLEELPMYCPPLKIPQYDPLAPQFDPDARWRRPALPLSKYVEGQMRLTNEGPPRKRSRYNYHHEDSDDEDDAPFLNEPAVYAQLPPITDEVALFRPEMKPIRDRIHAGHQFRPPTDHQMPLQSFYEHRSPSMWTQAEDDHLRSLVREYSYNWPLISSMLESKSLYSSGAERRTTWECFERWIQLEGLPSDMQKTVYFKAYQSRIEAAQRVVAHQQAAREQTAAANGGQPQPMRRRTTVPMRVERRRNQKHLTLLDAMRKLAKKRELAKQKSDQAAQTAQQNAANRPNMMQQPVRGACKTPQEYSLQRWRKDQELAEKLSNFATSNNAARRAAAMQARAQQVQAHGQLPPGTPGSRPGSNGQHPQQQQQQQLQGGPNGQPRPPQQAGMNNGRQPQARMAMPLPPNGMVPNSQVGGHAPVAHMNGGAQHPQMQNMQAMQGPQRVAMPPQHQSQQQHMAQGQQQGGQQQPDPNMVMRARQLSEQQRQAVQAQQQHMQVQGQPQQQQGSNGGTPRPPSAHNVQHSPSPNMANGLVNGVANGIQGMNYQNFANNNQQGMMTAFNQVNNGANGQASPQAAQQSVYTASPGSASRATTLPAPFQAQLQQLEAQIRQKNPTVKPDQARQLAMDHMLKAFQHQQRQNAMSSAAGVSNGGGQANQAQMGIAAGNIGATTSPHQYAQLLRQQQQAQAAQQQQQQAAQAQQQQQQQQAGQQQQSPPVVRQSSEAATPTAQ